MSSRSTAVAAGVPACCPPLFDAPLGEDEARDLADVLAVLADPARLRVLSMLAAAPDGEVCACELVEPLARSQPTVSHHLKVLFDAGLVDRERRGTWIFYRLREERLDALRAALAP
jgi:ArsR family transcriptional regulator